MCLFTWHHVVTLVLVVVIKSRTLLLYLVVLLYGPIFWATVFLANMHREIVVNQHARASTILVRTGQDDIAV